MLRGPGPGTEVGDTGPQDMKGAAQGVWRNCFQGETEIEGQAQWTVKCQSKEMWVPDHRTEVEISNQRRDLEWRVHSATWSNFLNSWGITRNCLWLPSSLSCGEFSPFTSQEHPTKSCTL